MCELSPCIDVTAQNAERLPRATTSSSQLIRQPSCLCNPLLMDRLHLSTDEGWFRRPHYLMRCASQHRRHVPRTHLCKLLLNSQILLWHACTSPNYREGDVTLDTTHLYLRDQCFTCGQNLTLGKSGLTLKLSLLGILLLTM